MLANETVLWYHKSGAIYGQEIKRPAPPPREKRETTIFQRRMNMDYQFFVDYVKMPCCVLSVEKNADGSCGEIRILCANQPYKDTMGPAYYDNMPYYELVPRDNKFEEFCFRAAILKEKMHAYVERRPWNAGRIRP